MLRLRERLTVHGRIPDNVRVIFGGGLPREFLAGIYRELVAPAIGSAPEVAERVVAAPDFECFVLMVGERAEGMLIVRSNDGNGLASVPALAVAPERRGLGWASALLTAAAIDRAWEAGARRLRFEMRETNREILRVARRARAVTVSRAVPYCRELGAG